jgi:hypothetical protein
MGKDVDRYLFHNRLKETWFILVNTFYKNILLVIERVTLSDPGLESL